MVLLCACQLPGYICEKMNSFGREKAVKFFISEKNHSFRELGDKLCIMRMGQLFKDYAEKICTSIFA